MTKELPIAMRHRAAAAELATHLAAMLSQSAESLDALSRELVGDQADDCSHLLSKLDRDMADAKPLWDALQILRSGIGGAFPTLLPQSAERSEAQ